MEKLKFNRTDDATNRLPFKPLEKYNNLCLCWLVNVAYDEKVSGEDKKWEFAGYDVGKPVFEFVQLKEADDDPERYHYHRELPQTVITTDGRQMTDSTISMRYQKIWNKVKHMYDAFSNHPNWQPFPFDPEFHPKGDADSRIKEWNTFFKDVVNAFLKGKDGKKPIFSSKHTIHTLMATKLIAGEKRLEFPEFAGTGFIAHATFKNNKLESNLEFKFNEGVHIESAQERAMPPVEQGAFTKATGGSGGAANLPSALKDALK